MNVDWMSAPWFRVTGIVTGGLVAWVILRRGMRMFREFLAERSQDDEHDRRIVTVMRLVKHLVGIVLIVIVLTLVFSELGGHGPISIACRWSPRRSLRRRRHAGMTTSTAAIAR